MHVIHSPAHAGHHGGMELHRGALVPCFEVPARADYILASVQRAGLPVLPPRSFPDAALLRVHDAAFVEFLRTAHTCWRGVQRQGSGTGTKNGTAAK